MADRLEVQFMHFLFSLDTTQPTIQALSKNKFWYTKLFFIREERIPTRCNNVDDLLSILMFNIDYCLDMFRASLCPSSGEKDHVLLHMGLFAGSVGCGWLRYCGATLQRVSTVKVAVGCEHCEGCCSSSNLHSAHTLQQPSQCSHAAT